MSSSATDVKAELHRNLDLLTAEVAALTTRNNDLATRNNDLAARNNELFTKTNELESSIRLLQSASIKAWTTIKVALAVCAFLGVTPTVLSWLKVETEFSASEIQAAHALLKSTALPILAATTEQHARDIARIGNWQSLEIISSTSPATVAEFGKFTQWGKVNAIAERANAIVALLVQDFQSSLMTALKAVSVTMGVRPDMRAYGHALVERFKVLSNFIEKDSAEGQILEAFQHVLNNGKNARQEGKDKARELLWKVLSSENQKMSPRLLAAAQTFYGQMLLAGEKNPETFKVAKKYFEAALVPDPDSGIPYGPAFNGRAVCVMEHELRQHTEKGEFSEALRDFTRARDDLSAFQLYDPSPASTEKYLNNMNYLDCSVLSWLNLGGITEDQLLGAVGAKNMDAAIEKIQRSLSDQEATAGNKGTAASTRSECLTQIATYMKKKGREREADILFGEAVQSLAFAIRSGAEDLEPTHFDRSKVSPMLLPILDDGKLLQELKNALAK